MFALINKIQNKSKPSEEHVDLIKKPRTAESIVSKRTIKSKQKSIRKDRFEIVIQKLRQEIGSRLDKAETKLTSLILEESSVSEPSIKDSVDDWKSEGVNINISKMQVMGVATQMADAKLPMAPRRPNELTDEELP